jgi:hypothetical protein
MTDTILPKVAREDMPDDIGMAWVSLPGWLNCRLHWVSLKKSPTVRLAQSLPDNKELKLYAKKYCRKLANRP